MVEILVVVGIVAIAALIGVANLQTIRMRFQLESGVRELTAFLQEVPNHAKETNASVFLVWDGTTRSFSITTSTIPPIIVLDTLEISERLTITGPGAPVLRCDIYGRTFVGTGTVMMTTLQTISVTHALTPEASAPTYVFNLSPLWAIEVTKS